VNEITVISDLFDFNNKHNNAIVIILWCFLFGYYLSHTSYRDASKYDMKTTAIYDPSMQDNGFVVSYFSRIFEFRMTYFVQFPPIFNLEKLISKKTHG
jgi:hypothetical protein